MKSNEKPQTRKQRRIEKKRMRAMARNHGRMPASLTEALDGDSSLPLDEVAKKLMKTTIFLTMSCFLAF